MSSKTAILTSKAPKPLPGIYSQAIVANGFVYCSGAIAMDPTSGKIIDGDIAAHTVSPSPPSLILHQPGI
jgi:enamine deaminase RidA (YjgF/YER057c/UK114 family)